MKKLMVVAVCCMAVSAMGAAFDLIPGAGAIGTGTLENPIVIAPGGTAEVILSVDTALVTNTMALDVMVFNGSRVYDFDNAMWIQDPQFFELSNVAVWGASAGTAWGTNYGNESLAYGLGVAGSPADWDYGCANVNVLTNSGTLNVAPGTALAKFTIRFDGDGSAAVNGIFTTAGLFGASGLANGAQSLSMGGDQIYVKGLPEPMTALLLLAGLPLLRRRHA